jgi:MoaA/NifB/PqqE/SkfB family radical SAM enzyme
MSARAASPARSLAWKTAPLPPMVCFRVTRYCNARCGFCLAPPDGSAHPAVDVLLRRIDWLLERGVRTIHFCGGEPTIHAGLSALVEHVHQRGAKTRLTTNAITISDSLISLLREVRAEVKVSLHGDREWHDEMVGVAAFDAAAETLRRLLAARVRTSVQSTVVANGVWVVDWLSSFCLEKGVRRLSLLPFIPRGHGLALRHRFELSSSERSALRSLVSAQRRALVGRLELRWLDFTARPFHVIEADGRVVLEGATEGMDVVLDRIPCASA